LGLVVYSASNRKEYQKKMYAYKYSDRVPEATMIERVQNNSRIILKWILYKYGPNICPGRKDL
jgi:hypothetical protein